MESDQLDYNTWHALHCIDDKLNSPWHLSVISNLNFHYDMKDKRILEIACGRGSFTEYSTQ